MTLRFDSICAASVEEMWRILAKDSIDTGLYHLCYPPHITLAIFPDEVSGEVLQAAFAQITAVWQALPVTLNGLGIFPGSPSVLWAVPVVTRELLDLHAMVCDTLPDVTIHPHYQPSFWIPHVTLSRAVENPDRAIAALLPGWHSISGFLDQADLVRFHPLEVVQSQALFKVSCG
ncbi:2'-5' RNA ligase family protein [Rhodopila sp.]|uniref:2'-5' RNA ligase family protein n=1 Tax=Rhodopila sp. TaxID=2480087 RepID=UPI003D10D80E